MNNLPYILINNNNVVGLSSTNRRPMYENKMCKSVGLIASCNNCDRIIFEDEKWLQGYKKSGGYCRECSKEIKKL